MYKTIPFSEISPLEVNSEFEYLNDINRNRNLNTSEIVNKSLLKNSSRQDNQVILLTKPDEQQQILDVIELEIPPAENNNIIVIKDEELPIKCSNCEKIFNAEEFEKHVCEYDDNKNFIASSVLMEEPEHPCFAQLQENSARIRKFLKEELKIDNKITLPLPLLKKQNGPHECNLCERKFVHASGLVRHMEKHTLDMKIMLLHSKPEIYACKVLLKCTLCGGVFPNISTARIHLFGDDPYFLNPVNYSDNEDEDNDLTDNDDTEIIIPDILSIVENNENHFLNTIILTSVFQCEFCELVFYDKDSVLHHAITHDPTKGYECKSCGIIGLTAKGISLHWQSECPFTKDTAMRHINLEKKIICNVCEESFTNLESLYEHRYNTVHLFPRICHSSDELQVSCESCGTVHNNINLLLSHYEEHHAKRNKKESTTSKYRQYLCDVCGKSYTQSSHLWQHLRFHRGVKPFACKEVGCNRRFTIRPDLNDHIRKCHTGERPYHCLVCGKRFLTGSVFYQHRLIHRGERRYGCDECGKRFYRADALKNHLRIHTGEKPYSCEICLKKFRQRGDRDKHIRARHNKDGQMNLKLKQQRSYNKRFSKYSSGNVVNNIPKDVVFVGNVPLPKSMFMPMITDIGS